MSGEIVREILKDIVSDLVGGAGITTISIPFIEDATDIVKLLCTIAGGVLLYFSIRYKILLYKDLKAKQEAERNFKK